MPQKNKITLDYVAILDSASLCLHISCWIQDFDKWIRTQLDVGGRTSSPSVWLGVQIDDPASVFIGGYDELVKWLSTRTNEHVPRPPPVPPVPETKEEQVATFVCRCTRVSGTQISHIPLRACIPSPWGAFGSRTKYFRRSTACKG